MKSFKNAVRQSKEQAASVPRRAQDIIPVERIYENGLFCKGRYYSKSWRLADVNYTAASPEDQKSIFDGWAAALNALEPGSNFKLTVINRKLTEEEINGRFASGGDAADAYNRHVRGGVDRGSIVQDKLITATVEKESAGEAEQFAQRVQAGLGLALEKIQSGASPLDAAEKLGVLHRFFRPDGPDTAIDVGRQMRMGHNAADWITPLSAEFKPDCFILDGRRYGRALFIRDFPNSLKDVFLPELCGFPAEMAVSVDYHPVPMAEAVRELENRLLGVEKNIVDYQRKSQRNNMRAVSIPYDLARQHEVTRELLDDLVARDQRMFFCLVTLVHMADSKAELDNQTERLVSIAQKHFCPLAPLVWQQMQGLQTALPFGVRPVGSLRTMITEAAAILIPFNAPSINHPRGLYFGRSQIDGSRIYIDRFRLQNANGWILAVPGGGKSMFAKWEIAARGLICPEDDVIIIDPQREYAALADTLGGTVINISSGSEHYINALDIETEEGRRDRAVKGKIEFVLSLLEYLMGATELSLKHKAVVSRCVTSIYSQYFAGGGAARTPTLLELRRELKKQPEPEAADVALALELYTDGGLDVFARQTNVDVDGRLLVYDINDLGDQLRPVGMLCILDNISRRLAKNRLAGRRTLIYIDEIYLLLMR